MVLTYDAASRPASWPGCPVVPRVWAGRPPGRERVPGARHVVDLGGGHGEYALEFARRGLRVTMQDRPA